MEELLTDCWGLHQECDDTEEVHVRIINCELHKYGPCVHVEPFTPEKTLQCAVDEDHRKYEY